MSLLRRFRVWLQYQRLSTRSDPDHFVAAFNELERFGDDPVTSRRLPRRELLVLRLAESLSDNRRTAKALPHALKLGDFTSLVKILRVNPTRDLIRALWNDPRLYELLRCVVLHSTDADARVYAIERFPKSLEISSTRRDEAVDFLLTLLRDDRKARSGSFVGSRMAATTVNQEAVHALDKIGDPRVVPTLLEELENPGAGWIALGAAKLMKLFGDERVAEHGTLSFGSAAVLAPILGRCATRISDGTLNRLVVAPDIVNSWTSHSGGSKVNVLGSNRSFSTPASSITTKITDDFSEVRKLAQEELTRRSQRHSSVARPRN